jgi:hypothetical protein
VNTKVRKGIGAGLLASPFGLIIGISIASVGVLETLAIIGVLALLIGVTSLGLRLWHGEW